MSFKKRGLSYKIELNKGGLANSSDQTTFDNGADKLTLDGLRSVASIQSILGGSSASSGHALLQLWGMKPSDMAQLSTLGFNPDKWNKNRITVFAYDLDNTNGKVEVFSGGIFGARINYNTMPDVSLELDCWEAINEQLQAVPGTSVQGQGDVATMLQGICAACDPPVTFVNKGVSAQLANPAYSGDPFHQMTTMCCDAAVPHTLAGGKLTIWQRDTNVDDTVIETSPDKGMVGYPEYTSMGIDVTMEFNSAVQRGRQLQILPTNTDNPLPIPGVPGTYWINVVEHELSSQMPGGPWFTRASVSRIQIAARH